MQLIAPVSDYIPASILTDLNDIVVRGVVLPERLPGILRALGTPQGAFTRDSSGNEVITGIGFNPSCVIFLASDTNPLNLGFSVGFDNGDSSMCIFAYDALTGITFDESDCIHLSRAAGNEISGHITARGADGFTLTFVEAGVSTARVQYIALP